MAEGSGGVVGDLRRSARALISRSRALALSSSRARISSIGRPCWPAGFSRCWRVRANLARCGRAYGSFIILLARSDTCQAGVPFFMVRKAGKMPNTINSASYTTEYDEKDGLALQRDAVKPGDKVMPRE